MAERTIIIWSTGRGKGAMYVYGLRSMLSNPDNTNQLSERDLKEHFLLNMPSKQKIEVFPSSKYPPTN